MQKKKGISLIVLVITIIVMIILAGTIMLSLTDNGIIGKSQQAVDATNEKEVQMLAYTLWSETYLDANGKATPGKLQQAVESGLKKNGVNLDNYIITATESGVELEKFDRDNWEHAYTYTRSSDEWSGKIEKTSGQQPIGDIIVKLYKTNEVVEPNGEAAARYTDLPITLSRGNAYKMLIEGTGDMGKLATPDLSEVYAWQLEFFAYAMGMSQTCVTPYITEVIIEDGVTNIGECALVFAESLKRIVKGNDLEKIEFRAVNACGNLESINISSTVKEIGVEAFDECSKLTTIYVESKEEWNNVIVGRRNYEILDAKVTYDYRTKVERLANEGWQKAIDEGKTSESEIQTAVNTYLTENGVTANELALYNITATTKSVNVTGKETTLGATILSGADYGKTVDYKANGINSWKVLYKQTVDGEEYVYLIASENAPANSLPTKLTDTIANGGAGAKFNGKNIYWESSNAPSVVASGSINKTRWLANWSDYATNENGRCITYFLDENYWTAFKNTAEYETNVVGAIGTPTVEMIVASYNERSEAIGDAENSTLTLTDGTYGYMINENNWADFSRLDKLYTPSYNSEEMTWLASPSDNLTSDLLGLEYSGGMGNGDYSSSNLGVRPVVSLKSSIPAYVGVSADSVDIILK